MEPENMQILRRAYAPIVKTLVGGAGSGKVKRLWAMAVLCLAFSAGQPAPAYAFTQVETSATRAVLADIDKGDFKGAHTLASRAGFPLLEKLVTWFDLTRAGSGADFVEITAFIKDNPDWPSQVLLRKHAEDAIMDSTPPADVLAWFQHYPAQGPNGAGRFVDTLLAAGQRANAEATVRQFLIDGTMTNSQMSEFSVRYQSLLRQVDFDLRADRIIWTGDTDGALALLSNLSESKRGIIRARAAFESQAPNAIALFNQLPSADQNDLGLMYDHMRWLRKQNRDAEALAILAAAPPILPHPELWWNEREVLARRALEHGDSHAAYELARDHRLATGSALADGEWLSGWIALRFLHDAKAAAQHFAQMLNVVTTPISISRAAYWSGRAAEALGDGAEADRFYKKGAIYIGTFYGQLSAAKVDPSGRLVLPPQPEVNGLDTRTFANRELVQVAQLLAAIGQDNKADPFVRRVGELARTPEDALLAMRLAKQTKSLAAEVQVSKKLMQGGMPVLADGFPVISKLGPTNPEPSLVHAIIRQESLFDASAVSPSGALGLMQLMPPTARSLAAKLKIRRFKTDTLTADPRTNVTIGASYLAELVDRFNGSYVLAIAGYNAGPGRVSGWLRDNGDPRSSLEDTIDWIEKIGIYQTRNYVQRVMENLEIYRARLAGGSTANAISKDLFR